MNERHAALLAEMTSGEPQSADLSERESTYLERVAARQAKAQKSYLQKVHGRSKYVVHQGAREKARRLTRAGGC